MKNFAFCLLLICTGGFTFCNAQAFIDSFRMYRDVNITLDAPSYQYKETMLILFALPNGNTTAQTMGKNLAPGDDWHFDIQHIKAQTSFLREKLKPNIVVAYLENDYKSWPLWKQKHPDFKTEIQHIVDTLYKIIPSKRKTIHLSGHSGGGSFIFGYLTGVKKIPAAVQRITFLDSDYGYDSSYYNKLKKWLKGNKAATLTVFAYNDSVALLNGKPFVSATGGTWYKSHLMLRHLQKDFSFTQTKNDSLIFYRSTNDQIAFFFKNNPDRKIFHTQQVELNGFIHSVLYRTNEEDKGYIYFGLRAYSKFIL
ncbi:MAG: hypothetical protein ABUT20_44835 [Bacteroidota bacterium]